MEWPSDKVLALIEAYRSRPCLWDPTCNTYKLKNMKNEAWENMASMFNCEIHEIKKKMDSLLSSFRRERQRLETVTTENGSTEIMYTSTWFAFRKMLFLLDKFQPKRSVKEIPDKIESNSCSSQDVKNPLQIDNNAVFIKEEAAELSPMIQSVHTCSYIASPEQPEKRKEPPQVIVHKPSKRPRAKIDDTKPDGFTFRTEDTFDYFGKYIASLLRELPTKKAFTLQQVVIDQVLQAHIQHLEESRNGNVYYSNSGNYNESFVNVMSPSGERDPIED